MNYLKIAEDCKKFPQETTALIAEGLKAGHIKSSEFNATDAFVSFFGYDRFSNLRASESASVAKVFQEAGAVMTTAFQNISQQFLSNIFMEAYQIPERIFMQMIPTVKTNRKFDRRAGISHVGDEFTTVDEGKNYPLVGVSEDWFDTPEVKKRGAVVRITKETIIFDETNLVVDHVKFLGDWLGVNHEKRAIDCLIDENTTAHRYNWKGTVYGSYVDTPWDNLSASTPLTDYNSLDTAFRVLESIVDPQTGEVQSVTGKHLIVARTKFNAAHNAIAPMVKNTTPGYATTGNPVQSEIPNPVLKALGGAPTVLCSPLVATRLGTQTTWFLGDITKYAEYREVWPVTFDTMAAGTQLGFDADIVQQFKASSMGAYGVKQPRAMVKCTA